MKLDDAVVLVTGASSGIGRATAERLALRGARVVAQGRDGSRLAELASQHGAVPVVADLAETGQAQLVADKALAVGGRIDILVNNAGVGWAGGLAEMPEPDITRLVAVNLAAPMALTRAVLPGMIARDAGSVLFVTSIAGRTAVAGEAVYSATKAGLDTFAESLRLELYRTGIRVGVFVPGVVDTPFFESRGSPYRRARPRPLPSGQVADALVQLIATGSAERYIPRWLRLPVLVRAGAPVVYRRLAARFGQPEGRWP